MEGKSLPCFPLASSSWPLCSLWLISVPKGGKGRGERSGVVFPLAIRSGIGRKCGNNGEQHRRWGLVSVLVANPALRLGQAQRGRELIPATILPVRRRVSALMPSVIFNQDTGGVGKVRNVSRDDDRFAVGYCGGCNQRVEISGDEPRSSLMSTYLGENISRFVIKIEDLYSRQK